MPPAERSDAKGADGNTPLDENELEGLIPPHLTTRAELNQWEARNIALAYEWIAKRTPDVLDLKSLRELHRRMFDETWIWAGSFRRSDKSISPYHWTEVSRLVRDLLANTQVRYEQGERTPEALDDLAVRFHHELVRIHPWPNGNGRHARLAAELLVSSWGRPPFSWGGAKHETSVSELRARYLGALKSADAGEFDELTRFARE